MRNKIKVFLRKVLCGFSAFYFLRSMFLTKHKNITKEQEMNKFQHMITAQYPYAVPGEDFTIKTGEDGHPVIGYWNAEKLGPEPSLSALHGNYMRWAMRKKEMLPKFDDSDPAPWLNAVEERTAVSRTIAQEANEDANLCSGKVCIYPNGTITRRVR